MSRRLALKPWMMFGRGFLVDVSGCHCSHVGPLDGILIGEQKWE